MQLAHNNIVFILKKCRFHFEVNQKITMQLSTSSRLLLCAAILLSLSSLGSTAKGMQECRAKRNSVTFTYEGCTATTKIATCIGHCMSDTLSLVDRDTGMPFLLQRCSCCTVTKSRIKRRLLNFNNCDDSSSPVSKRVWISMAEECSCTQTCLKSL